MTRHSLIQIATLGSLGLLAGAFLFQFAGYPPCELCLWQRWPHGAAILLGVIALSTAPNRLLPLLAAAACTASAAIAGFHSGVERKWWEGLESCSSGAGLGADLLSLEGPMIVPCDQIPWQIFGLSMANYNLLASLLLAAIWLFAARKSGTPSAERA